jgi:D-tyrosyl-tRNA(Tyr) deacylase
MKAVVQRVSAGAVEVGSEVVGAIGQGLVILLGVATGDSEQDADWVADKCVNLRIFSDADGKFNLSALDLQTEVLVVSQFTLCGDCRKGRRPNFTNAAAPDVAEALYDRFVATIAGHGLTTATGRFAANMQVRIDNDGPVTVIVER